MVAEPRVPPVGGFNFTWNPSLSDLYLPMKAILESRPDLDAVAAGALVFTKAFKGQDRVLLIQRASHDSMPLRWEIPGGGCDYEDETLLHGVARELWEESGLLLRSVVRQVGSGHIFFTRRNLRVCKFTFEAEVETAEGDSTSVPSEERVPTVTIDPNEHQRFLWASEDECRAHKAVVTVEGNREEVVELRFTTHDQEAVILEGFRVRREEPSTGVQSSKLISATDKEHVLDVS
ncbi:NUDIX hydrolase domain-like protein [Diplogelasinospora grovesii]|uniref:NUDIX hydrolase domain-like protein n=1 Tax=Diplogelasinospora grovesii TaxID=303347 RepID=A0AAN6NEJ9_9PEZI|nr:NUDIX hydrolase domain-like protein [Diplogelasinospora grovesii]